jgi:hypothetical protein
MIFWEWAAAGDSRCPQENRGRLVSIPPFRSLQIEIANMGLSLFRRDEEPYQTALVLVPFRPVPDFSVCGQSDRCASLLGSETEIAEAFVDA